MCCRFLRIDCERWYGNKKYGVIGVLLFAISYVLLSRSILTINISIASAVFFGFSLKEINLGIAYAVWSGV